MRSKIFCQLRAQKLTPVTPSQIWNRNSSIDSNIGAFIYNNTTSWVEPVIAKRLRVVPGVTATCWQSIWEWSQSVKRQPASAGDNHHRFVMVQFVLWYHGIITLFIRSVGGYENSFSQDQPQRDSNPQFPDPKSEALSVRPSGHTLRCRLTSGMVCKDGTLSSHLASTVVSFSKY